MRLAIQPKDHLLRSAGTPAPALQQKGRPSLSSPSPYILNRRGEGRTAMAKPAEGLANSAFQQKERPRRLTQKQPERFHLNCEPRHDGPHELISQWLHSTIPITRVSHRPEGFMHGPFIADITHSFLLEVR